MKPILPQYVFGQRSGNRLRFAVEFEAYKLPDGSFPRMWNEWWGYLWLWVDGRIVGNPFEYEFIWSGLGPLVKDASETGKRGSSLLSTYQPKEALEIVMKVLDDDVEAEKSAGDPANPGLLQILPGVTGPFFDGWEAILLEQGDTEHFIYRQKECTTVEAVWQIGTFRDAILEAKNGFETLARSNLIGGMAALDRR
jgi:hypothetical protein